MSHAYWQDGYKINVHKLDIQHEELAKLVKRLHDAVNAKQDMETLGGILSDLLGSTRHHFSTEEKLMREYDYPGYKKHRSEHDEILEQLKCFRQETVGRSHSVFRFDFDATQDWFIKHIDRCDRELAVFLNEKGVY
ncbi:MAG: hemerythrin family protein [Gammaproteobacteria bacterium]|nr:hemerythrin family protein [Gammaproteobacteria bacterium]